MNAAEVKDIEELIANWKQQREADFDDARIARVSVFNLCIGGVERLLERHSERSTAESEKPEPLPDTGGQFYACPVCRRVNRIGQPCVDDPRHRREIVSGAL